MYLAELCFGLVIFYYVNPLMAFSYGLLMCKRVSPLTILVSGMSISMLMSVLNFWKEFCNIPLIAWTDYNTLCKWVEYIP